MAEFIRPSALTNDTLRAVSLALKLMPRGLRSKLNKESRSMGNAIWRPIVDSHARSLLDRRVLAKGARVKPGNPMTLTAATSKRKLSGGLIPDESGRAFEFGTWDRDRVTGYDRKSKRGGSHTVKRHTTRQMPKGARTGRVIYQAAAEIAPRITAHWVQTIVRNIYNAHEGKS